MGQTPDIADVIDDAIDLRLDDVYTSMPGIVASYDPATQSASVQPAVDHTYENERGERVTERLPIIKSVPIKFQGSGPYRITFPIAAGDPVLLVFTSCPLGAWLAKGGIVRNRDARRFKLGDAIAIPGLHSFANVPTTAPTNAMVLHADAIRLGGPDADDPIARKSDLAALASAIASSPDGVGFGTALKASLATYYGLTSPWPSCPSKVKSE